MILFVIIIKNIKEDINKYMNAFFIYLQNSITILINSI